MALLPFGADSGKDTNVVELLRKDHEKVKMLFREFESAEEAEQKMKIVQQAISELEVHASAEEKIFYPAVRKDSPDAAPNLNESLEEHHVMKFLLGELRDMSPGDERFDAKFTVLAENVKHHIKEEESELFARARTGDLNLNELGKKLLAAKSSFRSSQNKQKRKVTSKRKQVGSKALQGARDKKLKKRGAVS
ncbi:MAG: hemerythrin domain-containing protein [Nitrospirales bacterium]